MKWFIGRPKEFDQHGEYMRAMILGVAALIVCTGAHAAKWVIAAEHRISAGEFRVWEIDTDSVTMRDGFRQAWVRLTVSPPDVDQKGEPFRSALTLSIFNCVYKESAALQWVAYSEWFGEGEVISKYLITRAEAKAFLKTEIPGTFGERILNTACSMSLK